MDKKLDSAFKIRRRILIPLTIAFIILVFSGVVCLYLMQHQYIVDDTRLHLERLQTLFYSEITEDTSFMSYRLNEIQNNQALSTAFLKNNREDLLSLSLPIFNQLKNEYDITHFYFLDKDRVCFLRVHNPLLYGDKIDRFTAVEAEKYKHQANGMELGPLGTFTLRVVKPWIIDGKLIGYLELGKELNSIIPELKQILDVEIFVSVNKKFLTKQGWLEGLEMLGLPGDWEQFPNFVIVDNTSLDIPEKLSNYLKRLKTCDDNKHLNNLIEVSLKGKIYMCGFLVLRDASKVDVGDIIMMIDITREKKALFSLIASFVLVSLVVGIVFALFFYVFSGLVQRGIIDANSTLFMEISERMKIEQDLVSANMRLSMHEKELKELVIKITDLNKTMEDKDQEFMKKMQALKEMNSMMLDRENRMIELKREINALSRELGRPEPYVIH